MRDGQPFTFFDTVGANVTGSLKGLQWSAQALTLGNTGSNSLSGIGNPGEGKSTVIKSGANVVGGLLIPDNNTEKYLLDFAGVGAAAGVPQIEIGKIPIQTGIAIPLATVTLTLTIAAPANINPFTGESIPATTFRFFDLAAIAAAQKGQLNQVQVNVGGAANDVSQLILDVTEAVYYYVLWVVQSTPTRLLGVATPKYLRFPGNS